MEKYEEEFFLGKGRFGIAFRVKCKETGEYRCLKKISLRQANLGIANLLNETDALKTLQHPNIVKYYEHFLDNDLFCIVTEYADEGDLQQYINKQTSQIPESEILNIGRQVFSAAAYIHSQHIIHRDLKPENILKFSNGVYKIGDFALSILLEKALGKMKVGSIPYMAPEFFTKSPYSFPVDAWSLGCTLYELMTRQPAFQDPSNEMVKIVEKIKNENPEPITGSYSRELTQVVHQLLMKNPESRISTVDCANVFKNGLKSVFSHTKESMMQLKESAEGGDPDAMNLYALLLESGFEDIPPNKKEALIWFKRSAEGGNVEAMNNYAVILYDGFQGFPPNIKEAAFWFHRSAEGGNVDAMSNYASLLKDGIEGSPPNKKEAAFWFKKSAERGNIDAMYHYALLTQAGFEGSPPNKKEAILWYKRSAEKGHVEAMNIYGLLLESLFEGTEANMKEASIWYKKAAERGNIEAMNNYAVLLFDGFEDIPPNKREAAIWFKRSAEGGNVEAMNNYASLLEDGFEGFPPNKKEAAFWHMKSGN